MKIDIKKFRARSGSQVKLKKWPTQVKPVYRSKKQYRNMLDKQVSELIELQEMQYAGDRYALLLIFQAMDAAGKDGAIRHVMSGVNPHGCRFTASSSQAPKNSTTTSCGVPAVATLVWPHRHIQSLLLRRSAGGEGAPGNPRRRSAFPKTRERGSVLAGALQFDRRARAPSAS